MSRPRKMKLRRLDGDLIVNLPRDWHPEAKEVVVRKAHGRLVIEAVQETSSDRR